MKKLSKIVALLLAGALTMLLFTACSGGGGSSSSMSEDKDAETKVMGLIQKREVPQACRQNDSDMQKIAAAKLDEDLKGAFDVLGYKFKGNVHVEGENEQYLIVTVTANYWFDGTLLNKLLQKIENSDKLSSFNANINQSGKWSKVGVVVKTNTSNKQSFVAITFKIENPNYNKNK